MKNIFFLKLAALVTLLTLGAFGTAQAKSESCNASDGLEGWGIWCGVETYAAKMAEESPTAAGPLPSALTQLRLEPTIDPNWLRPQLDPTAESQSDPVLPITLPEPADPTTLVGYTRTTEYTRSNEISDTSKAMLGTLTLKLDTAGIIQLTRFNAAGETIVSIELSGNDPLFGPPSNPRRSTRVTIDPTKQSRASARKTTTSNEPSFEEERFSAHEEKQDGSGILKEYWVGTHSLYSSSNSEITDIDTHFIAGHLTPLADIERLSAGNVTATYTGKSAFWQWDVNIDVDFKNKSFDGSWGEYGASGIITRQHIIATAIRNADSGMVQASFFGANAQKLGGAAEFTKGATTQADVFSTSKQ